ncbi:type I secretion system permease/ATPase, partial [Vibrio parahaemolyticus]|nr:type I secretion system permease/ATPase [Vibrio parahaemolyticus]
MKHHSSSSSELTNDPWGQSLTWLMRYFEVRHHTKKVLSGLPLVEGRLDSDLFIRAAERADLELTLIDLKSTAMLSFPLVVINRKTLQPAIISERHNSDYQVTLF